MIVIDMLLILNCLTVFFIILGLMLLTVSKLIPNISGKLGEIFMMLFLLSAVGVFIYERFLL